MPRRFLGRFLLPVCGRGETGGTFFANHRFSKLRVLPAKEVLYDCDADATFPECGNGTG
jgi:hypothetical protein